MKGNNPTDWRTAQFYNYWSVPNHYGIRTDRYTYVKIANYPPELFDRESDPDQLHNVYEKPEFKGVIQELEVELQKQISELGIGYQELPAGDR